MVLFIGRFGQPPKLPSFSRCEKKAGFLAAKEERGERRGKGGETKKKKKMLRVRGVATAVCLGQPLGALPRTGAVRMALLPRQGGGGGGRGGLSMPDNLSSSSSSSSASSSWWCPLATAGGGRVLGAAGSRRGITTKATTKEEKKKLIAKYLAPGLPPRDHPLWDRLRAGNLHLLKPNTTIDLPLLGESDADLPKDIEQYERRHHEDGFVSIQRFILSDARLKLLRQYATRAWLVGDRKDWDAEKNRGMIISGPNGVGKVPHIPPPPSPPRCQ